MLKKNVDENDLKVFELFISKQKSHYDNIRMWHTLILTINSLIFGSIAFIVGTQTKSDKEFDLSSFLSSNEKLLIPICILGVIFCMTWFLTHIDSARWQNKMNDVLRKCENKILKSPNNYGMWNMITSSVKSHDKRFKSRILFDMIYVQSLVPVSFLCIWVYLIILIITN